jgi:hypothetical protein
LIGELVLPPGLPVPSVDGLCATYHRDASEGLRWRYRCAEEVNLTGQR